MASTIESPLVSSPSNAPAVVHTLLPRPARIELSGTDFQIDPATLSIGTNDPAFSSAVRILARLLKQRFGREIRVAPGAAGASIRFQRAELGHAEAYTLSIDVGGVVITAGSAAGAFYAVQTLKQWIGAADAGVWPAVKIEDRPRFRWRGLMLDVSRHLFSKADILRHLDAMAMHKLNVFHWHLTDDQGWRIEIRKHPKLTGIGAFRDGADGVLCPSRQPPQPPGPGTYGGFFSQDDVREIVAYAAERHITVVPEIEMPGHASAALAAYPELACADGPFKPATQMGIFKDVYCAGNDAVFALLEDVLAEVVELFPGTYIHVGGDECPKDRWKTCPKCQARIRAEGLADEHELQSYFIRRMEKFLAARGKRLIGWDEILEGGLPPDATVMSWRGTVGGIAAAKAGHDVVMTPHYEVYFDYRQADEGEPPAIRSDKPVTVQSVYHYEPVPAELSAEQRRHIIGVQANLWTEYVFDFDHVQYMTWPRAAALAEIAWSPAERDWPDFRRRLAAHVKRLAAAGVRCRPLD